MRFHTFEEHLRSQAGWESVVLADLSDLRFMGMSCHGNSKCNVPVSMIFAYAISACFRKINVLSAGPHE